MQAEAVVVNRGAWRPVVVLGGVALALALVGGLAADLRASAEPASPPAAHDGKTTGHGPRPSRLPKGAVWVVNRDLGGSLTVFDASSGEVAVTVPNIGAGAHDICIVERVGKAFITAEAIHAVVVVDLETLATDTIPVAPMPHHCEPSRNGRELFVSLSAHTPAPGAPQLAVIDTRDYSVRYVTTSANLSARAHGPSPAPFGDTLYVAHDTGDEVTGVDLSSGEIELSVAPILRAEEVVATRFGEWLWASSRGDGTVKRIHRRSGAIAGVVGVGTEPESVMLTPSQRTLAVSLRGSPATVAFVDTASESLTASVPIAPVVPCGATAEARSFGDLAVMSPDGDFVFATFDRAAACQGGVSVIDVRTRQVVAVWPYPGNGRPHGVDYTRKKPRF